MIVQFERYVTFDPSSIGKVATAPDRAALRQPRTDMLCQKLQILEESPPPGTANRARTEARSMARSLRNSL